MLLQAVVLNGAFGRVTVFFSSWKVFHGSGGELILLCKVITGKIQRKYQYIGRTKNPN